MKNNLCALAVVAVTALTSSAAFSDAIDDTMTKAGCMACHTVDKKLVGPSFRDIATKRKSEANAVTTLMEKVRKGGTGAYGPIPMPPNPVEKINDADLKGAVEKILKS